jgi:hypothetical protein
LGVDCSETLFMGATNIVVEGVTDQKVLVAGIQRFGKAEHLDEYLDLNKVVFVSAGGASYVKQLIERSLGGDDRRPIVVALTDGDTPGNKAFEEVTQGGVLEKELATTLDQIALPSNKKALVLEDLIPTPLLSLAVSRYVKDRWGADASSQDVLQELNQPESGKTTAHAVVKSVKTVLGAGPNIPTDEEIKGGVIGCFVEWLLDDDGVAHQADLAAFDATLRAVYAKLRIMIDEAERRSWKDTLHKCVGMIIEGFDKSHSVRATRADTERCLVRLELECSGFTPEARRARENVNELKELLQQEVASTAEGVDLALWRQRLTTFRQAPWSRPKNGWNSVPTTGVVPSSQG